MRVLLHVMHMSYIFGVVSFWVKFEEYYFGHT